VVANGAIKIPILISKIELPKRINLFSLREPVRAKVMQATMLPIPIK